MRFFLGVEAAWLHRAEFCDVPMFVSHRALRDRRTRFLAAVGPYAIDSGGYTEVTTEGRWVTTPAAYVDSLRRYHEQIGPFDFAACQDWMCTPDALTATGRTITDHQARTVTSVLDLRAMTDLPIAPVLQGWDVADFLRHVDTYAAHGIDLTAEPVVMVGSIAARESGLVAEVIVHELALLGVAVHGLGMKTRGLRRARHYLTSADSMSWSYAARKRAVDVGGPMFADCTHANCSHCPRWALAWRDSLTAALDDPTQLAMTMS